MAPSKHKLSPNMPRAMYAKLCKSAQQQLKRSLFRSFNKEGRQGNMLVNNLKLIRLEKNISQEETAGAIGVARSTYAMYESGWRYPGVETLYSIARFFRVPMEYLYADDNSHYVDDLTMYLKMGDDQQKINDLYVYLTPYFRGRLIELAESLKREQVKLVRDMQNKLRNKTVVYEEMLEPLPEEKLSKVMEQLEKELAIAVVKTERIEAADRAEKTELIESAKSNEASELCEDAENDTGGISPYGRKAKIIAKAETDKNVIRAHDVGIVENGKANLVNHGLISMTGRRGQLFVTDVHGKKYPNGKGGRTARVLTDEELKSHLEYMNGKTVEDIIKEKRRRNAEKEAAERGGKI